MLNVCDNNKKVDCPPKFHHSLLALVRLLVGFKCKNWQSQKGKHLVAIILMWGEKPSPRLPEQTTNETWRKLSHCFMLLSTNHLPLHPPPISCFRYLATLFSLRIYKPWILSFVYKEQISQETKYFLPENCHH